MNVNFSEFELQMNLVLLGCFIYACIARGFLKENPTENRDKLSRSQNARFAPKKSW